MVRLRNVRTGAIVSVRDEKATILGAEWVPVETGPAPTSRAKRTTRAAPAAPAK